MKVARAAGVEQGGEVLVHETRLDAERGEPLLLEHLGDTAVVFGGVVEQVEDGQAGAAGVAGLGQQGAGGVGVVAQDYRRGVAAGAGRDEAGGGALAAAQEGGD